MSRVEEVSQLLAQWEDENNANGDVTSILMKLAELFEVETDVFLKKDPDPFDDRHPSRLQPDCTLGHMLKTIFRNEQIVDEIVKVYCQRDVEQLNIAACRLLLDILPGLENVIFQEEGFVPRLFDWAEKATNPLKSYATGLLAAAMDVPDIAANYREKNAYFVPLMLRRLHDLSNTYLISPQEDASFSHENHRVPKENGSYRPFAHIGASTSKSFPKTPKDSSQASRKRAFTLLDNISDDEDSADWCPTERSFEPVRIMKVPALFRQLNGVISEQDPTTSSTQSSPIPSRPFATICEKSYEKPPDSPPDSKHKKPKRLKKEVQKEEYKPSPILSASQDGSVSNWNEMENNVIGSSLSYQVYPLTLASELRFILQYLTPMGEYQDLLGVVIEENALPLILRYIDKQQNPDVRLSFEATKYLASLLCHKKIALEFLHIGGLQVLLKVPRPSIAATGVSICFYYLAYIEEAMEKISLLPLPVILDFVRYTLWLLECSHDSSRAHATMTFGFAFAFKIILHHFDEQDGLRKLFNVMSTLDLENSNNLSDDQIFSNRQTTRHVCGALKRYFEAHLVLEVETRASMRQDIDQNPNKQWKAMNLSNENIEKCMEIWRETLSPNLEWAPVDLFLNLDGVSFLLELTSYFELGYSGRHETVKNALDVLKICSLTAGTQLSFCEKISSPHTFHMTGILVILQAADGELMTVAERERDIQRAALHIIINCVCTRLDAADIPLNILNSMKKHGVRTLEDLLKQLWRNIRIKNGIIILINLLSIKSPLTDADSIRALACRALCGLARSETVKQLISKLPLMTDGLLLDLMKEPVLQDKGREHVQFCKFGLELIERVTGTPVSTGSESSVLNINKSEIVAKTKVVYNESQLLQLICDHLSSVGYNDSARSLQKEMEDKKEASSLLPFSPLSPSNNVNNVKIEPKKKFIQSAYSSSPVTPIPLKIVIKKTQVQEPKINLSIKLTPSRLQKTQTCSGNYRQTPAMKRHGTSNYAYIMDSQPTISLDSIVTEYLRKQHALCKCPMMACPPFDLLVPHKCPESINRRKAPENFVVRTEKKQILSKNGFGAALDRKFIYSKFRLVRSFRDDEEKCDFACSTFINYPADRPVSKIIVGTVTGPASEIKVFNLNTGEEEWSRQSFSRGTHHIESSKFNSLVLTSDNGRRGNSTLWKYGNNLDEMHSFTEVSHMEFGKRNSDKAIGTKYESAAIYDTNTCIELQSFPHGDYGNNFNYNYEGNRATYDYSDELILSDGLIYDVRSGKIIHKLDKFNARFNGVFHPNAREIISNTEIWDLRTFKLLRTVPTLDQCRVTFSPTGNVIYGVFVNSLSPPLDERANCYYTFDAYDYSIIATMDVKRPVYNVSADINDRYIATIECQTTFPDVPLPPIPGVDCVCRLYEIGRTKEEGDEDAEESDSEEESDDDGDGDDDDDDNNDGQIEDDVEDITFELDASSDSLDDDEAFFSLNASDND